MKFGLAVLAALIFNEVRAADLSRIGAIHRPMSTPRPAIKIQPGVIVETNGVLVYRSSRFNPPREVLDSPFRKIDGKIFDITSFFQQLDQFGTQWTSEWTSYNAVVVQVLPEGLLVRNNNRSVAVYFLRNYPRKSGLTDGSEIHFIARSSSPFQYTDVQNAVRTIDSVDFGEMPNSAEWEQIVSDWKKSVEASNLKKQIEASEAEERARAKQRETDSKVVQLLEERVQKGSIDAAIELADRYASGKGVVKDLDKSAQLRELAEKRKREKR